MESAQRSVDEVGLFLLAMQEFGLFEAVERHLPKEFAAVYEIARVLLRPDNPLAQRLAPLFGLLASHATLQRESVSKPLLHHQFVAEEYEAELIRHYRDVARIYSHQFLLPEEVFYHRLAERSLWMPVARPPQVYGYQTQADVYAPDIRKQKVYVLLDTSASMQMHHRIQLAKAITYIFLRRNQAELGEVFFRTFDLQLGELLHASDRASFEKLLQTVLRLRAVGQGTALEQAIVTAVNDIRRRPSLAQSEILVITDGIAYLHVQQLRELLGTDIRLHAVRLGAGQLQLKAKAVEDFAYRDDSEPSRLLRKLSDEKRHVERLLANASGEQQRRSLANQLRALEQQYAALFTQVEQQAHEHYSTALQQLCTVFVAVEDMELASLVELSAERRVLLEKAVQQFLERLRDLPTAQDYRDAAVLAEYLSFLAECCPEASSLQALEEQLRTHVARVIRQGEYVSAHQRVSLNRMERRSLMVLAAASGSSLEWLLRLLSPLYWFRRLRLWLRRRLLRLRWRFR
ncbi:MAG: VWA domain-containing protein [Candidatus Kapabacteria bacterium]|nr:VWA domain-containing protein [Candidatus Kapabacteria bacterium]MDW8011718.1 VWA domain-containing protein [Bacteroidota bacterium]